MTGLLLILLIVPHAVHWARGRDLFVSICSRCHGDDGTRAGYQDIKTLGGIGKRLTEPEIRKRVFTARLGPDHVVIRGYHLNQRDLDALIAYVRSL